MNLNGTVNFNSKTCVINFDAFTGDKITSLFVSYDP